MNIAWLPQPPDSPGSVLAGGTETVWLPYLADGAERRGGEVRLEGAFYPSRRNLPAKVRTFIDFLVESLSGDRPVA